MYCLFDANVIAAYYLPATCRSEKVVDAARALIESVRSGGSSHFFYIPNFCIAEVFSVFMKHTYGHWNPHVKHGTVDGRVHNSVRKQFQEDIHNARLFYHFELTRYHVLALNLVAPIDHYYQLAKKTKKNRHQVRPAGTFDHLIVAMAVHLVKIHGAGDVCLITADERLERIVSKCKTTIPYTARRRLKLTEAEDFTGIAFEPDSFPHVLNLRSATQKQYVHVFGEWPPPRLKKYERPYLAKKV